MWNPYLDSSPDPSQSMGQSQVGGGNPYFINAPSYMRGADQYQPQMSPSPVQQSPMMSAAGVNPNSPAMSPHQGGMQEFNTPDKIGGMGDLGGISQMSSGGGGEADMSGIAQGVATVKAADAAAQAANAQIRNAAANYSPSYGWRL